MTRREGGPDRREAEGDLRRASRRGVLAVGAVGLLAGCLVTSEEEEAPGTRQTDNGANESDADGEDDRSNGSEGGGSDGSGDGESETTPDEVGPDGSGLVVTDSAVLNVREGGGRTTVSARLTVENAGRFEYGVVEFRVDAYATQAGTDEREAVGFAYVTQRYSPPNRFDGSRPRRFDVEITFPSDRTRVRPDPERYVVDAAVRRAEPI